MNRKHLSDLDRLEILRDCKNVAEMRRMMRDRASPVIPLAAQEAGAGSLP
jgi:hypothetical protein